MLPLAATTNLPLPKVISHRTSPASSGSVPFASQIPASRQYRYPHTGSNGCYRAGPAPCTRQSYRPFRWALVPSNFSATPPLVSPVANMGCSGTFPSKITDKSVTPVGKSGWLPVVRHIHVQHLQIFQIHMDAKLEKNRWCNVDYEKAGHPRKATRYRSSSFEMK